jgi:hypothetical protein
LWVVTPCGLVGNNASEEHTASICRAEKVDVPPEVWYVPAVPHGITTHKTNIAVRISDLVNADEL